MIRIGREIQCLPYAGFLFLLLLKCEEGRDSEGEWGGESLRKELTAITGAQEWIL